VFREIPSSSRERPEERGRAAVGTPRDALGATWAAIAMPRAAVAKTRASVGKTRVSVRMPRASLGTPRDRFRGTESVHRHTEGGSSRNSRGSRHSERGSRQAGGRSRHSSRATRRNFRGARQIERLSRGLERRSRWSERGSPRVSRGARHEFGAAATTSGVFPGDSGVARHTESGCRCEAVECSNEPRSLGRRARTVLARRMSEPRGGGERAVLQGRLLSARSDRIPGPARPSPFELHEPDVSAKAFCGNRRRPGTPRGLAKKPRARPDAVGRRQPDRRGPRVRQAGILRVPCLPEVLPGVVLTAIAPVYGLSSRGRPAGPSDARARRHHEVVSG